MWPKLNQKAYWATLKSFTNWKKIPVVSPLLMNDHFVTNFNKKNNRFDNFFVYSSKLPLNKVSITKSFISSVNIKESEILNILKSLDARKANGHGDISIRVPQLSHKSISKPLKLLFENWSMQIGTFPDQ